MTCPSADDRHAQANRAQIELLRAYLAERSVSAGLPEGANNCPTIKYLRLSKPEAQCELSSTTQQ